jgi:hypothetical protein
VKTVLGWLNAVRDELEVEAAESLLLALERQINDENWLGLEQNQALIEALVRSLAKPLSSPSEYFFAGICCPLPRGSPTSTS